MDNKSKLFETERLILRRVELSDAEDMFNNINPRKWICVSAEAVRATSHGDIAILIMSSEEMSKSVYYSFKQKAELVGKELYKVVEETVIEQEEMPAMY